MARRIYHLDPTEQQWEKIDQITTVALGARFHAAPGASLRAFRPEEAGEPRIELVLSIAPDPLLRREYLEYVIAPDGTSGRSDDSPLEIRIEGQYGDPEGSLHIEEADGTELLMWDSAEWAQDPSLVYVIAHALHKALADPAAFRATVARTRPSRTEASR